MILIEEVKVQGKPVGVVVAIGQGRVGYSICNPIEKFRLGRAIEIAVGRAQNRREMSVILRLENVFKGFCEERRRRNGATADPAVTKRRSVRSEELTGILCRVDVVLFRLRDLTARSTLMTW